MGTRAVITFKDDTGSASVYQHWDGDPDTVRKNIADTITSGLCWEWPRWEADEFCAAYIAANKKSGGNIRTSKGPRHHGDLSYQYIVKFEGYSLMMSFKLDGIPCKVQIPGTFVGCANQPHIVAEGASADAA